MSDTNNTQEQPAQEQQEPVDDEQMQEDEISIVYIVYNANLNGIGHLTGVSPDMIYTQFTFCELMNQARPIWENRENYEENPMPNVNPETDYYYTQIQRLIDWSGAWGIFLTLDDTEYFYDTYHNMIMGDVNQTNNTEVQEDNDNEEEDADEDDMEDDDYTDIDEDDIEDDAETVAIERNRYESEFSVLENILIDMTNALYPLRRTTDRVEEQEYYYNTEEFNSYYGNNLIFSERDIDYLETQGIFVRDNHPYTYQELLKS
jgi:NACalpha-BTF3-like transcription factor